MSGRLAFRNWFELLRRLVIDFNTTPATSIGWAIGLTGGSEAKKAGFDHISDITLRRLSAVAAEMLLAGAVAVGVGTAGGIAATSSVPERTSRSWPPPCCVSAWRS